MFSSLMLENKTNVQVVFQAKVKHAYSVKTNSTQPLMDFNYINWIYGKRKNVTIMFNTATGICTLWMYRVAHQSDFRTILTEILLQSKKTL